MYKHIIYYFFWYMKFNIKGLHWQELNWLYQWMKKKGSRIPPQKSCKCRSDKDQNEKTCWIIINFQFTKFTYINFFLWDLFRYMAKSACVKSFSCQISFSGWRLEIHVQRVSDHSLCVNYMSTVFSGLIFFPHKLRSPLQKFLGLHTPHSQPHSNMFATFLKSCIIPSMFYPLVLPRCLWFMGIMFTKYVYLLLQNLLLNSKNAFRYNKVNENQVTHPCTILAFFQDGPIPKVWSRSLNKNFWIRMLILDSDQVTWLGHEKTWLL